MSKIEMNGTNWDALMAIVDASIESISQEDEYEKKHENEPTSDALIESESEIDDPCEWWLPIECMRCGKADGSLRELSKDREDRDDDEKQDGKEQNMVRLVQHNENGCAGVLAVCDECIRECKGEKRLECTCCGQKVYGVITLESGKAAVVARNFAEQINVVEARNKSCGYCQKQVALLTLHARYGCGALLDACFECAARVDQSMMCSGCSHKVCGQVVPIGALDAARSAMGKRKRKTPQRYTDIPEEALSKDENGKKEQQAAKKRRLTEQGDACTIEPEQGDACTTKKPLAKIVPNELETFEQAKADAKAFVHVWKRRAHGPLSAKAAQKQQRRAAVARLLWGPLSVVNSNVQRCRLDLETRLAALKRDSSEYVSVRKDLTLLLRKYDKWQARCNGGATAATNENDVGKEKKGRNFELVDNVGLKDSSGLASETPCDIVHAVKAAMETDVDTAFALCKARTDQCIVTELLISCACDVAEVTVARRRQLFQMLVAEYGEHQKELLALLRTEASEQWVRDALDVKKSLERSRGTGMQSHSESDVAVSKANKRKLVLDDNDVPSNNSRSKRSRKSIVRFSPEPIARLRDWQEVERNSGRPQLRNGLHRYGRRAYRKFLSGEALAGYTWCSAMRYIAHYDLVECVQPLMDIWQGSDDEMWILIHQAMSRCVDQNSAVYNVLAMLCDTDNCEDCLLSFL